MGLTYEPTTQPPTQPSSQPSVMPSISVQPSQVPSTFQPTDEPLITRPQCENTNDCLCGVCDESNQCINCNNSNRPDKICIKPSGSSCNTGSSLNVAYKPPGNCIPQPPTFLLGSNQALCSDGWLIERPSSCKFYNDLELTTSCVNGGNMVNIHTSCSQEVALCNEYDSSYTIVGYSFIDGDTWYIDV